MMMLLCCRRRRVHKANLVYAQQQSAEMGQNYQPPNQGGMQGAFFPHYQVRSSSLSCLVLVLS